MANIKYFFILLLFISQIGLSQDKFTLSGNIKDVLTGEDLIGATIFVLGHNNLGASTNNYGFYSITLPQGKYSFVFQYVGYQVRTDSILLDRDTRFNINLSEKLFEIQDVTVTSQSPDNNVSSTEMGTVRLNPKMVDNIPVILGERDIIKIVQLTPGVKPAGEGNSGYYVRGGGIDQNLILLDEAPVYNASHLLGFFSVFNSEAIKDATMYKSSIPAEFGGRASSVLDIKMKDGNLKKYSFTGNIGLISSSAAVEGPIVKDKGSFIISGRRTYADQFLFLSNDNNVKNSILFFYDINLKANYRINANNRVFVSGYFGRDNFGFNDRFGFNWGSTTGTLRWNHNFGSKLFSNTSVIFSNYSYQIDLLGDLNVGIRSEIFDWNFKQDFSYYLNSSNTLKFGGNIIYHNILPGEIKADGSSSFTSMEISRRRAIESALYVSNGQDVSAKLKLNYGLRLALFSNVGPGEFYQFGETGLLDNTIVYDKFELVKTQGGLEPRLGATLKLTSSSSVKASYNRIYQFLHLLSNSTTTTPTDVWLPSSDNVKPQISDQLSFGYFKNLNNNSIETSIEVYYKNLLNQIDYKNGAELVFNKTVESELVFGKGWSYGIEFYAKKNMGRLTGWAGYTWSKTRRLFPEINNGKAYPVRQDRTHDFSVVAMYDVSEKVQLSATWIFYSGDAVTFPSGKYEIDGMVVPYYTERNGYRMPDYHRLDLGLVWTRKKTPKFESSWSFSVYNAYGRENAYFIEFRQNEDNPEISEAVQVSLFKAIPSVSYKFKF